MTDRPVNEQTDELEVTPEMIEIGISALLEDSGVAFGIEHFSAEEAVERVFRAMDAVRSTPSLESWRSHDRAALIDDIA